MIRKLLPLLALSTLASASPHPSETFTGHYTVQWEVMAFNPCDSEDAWWVADPGRLSAEVREVLGDSVEYGTVYARVSGELSEPGRWGHMGRYRRMLSVKEVVEVRRAARDDCRQREPRTTE